MSVVVLNKFMGTSMEPILSKYIPRKYYDLRSRRAYSEASFDIFFIFSDQNCVPCRNFVKRIMYYLTMCSLYLNLIKSTMVLTLIPLSESI